MEGQDTEASGLADIVMEEGRRWELGRTEIAADSWEALRTALTPAAPSMELAHSAQVWKSMELVVEAVRTQVAAGRGRTEDMAAAEEDDRPFRREDKNPKEPPAKVQEMQECDFGV